MNASNKKNYIQKCTKNFKDVDGGCTIFPTKSLQNITDPICLAIFVYLSSKPCDWKINIKELMSHFSIGRNKTYKAINDLILSGLIKKKEIREKGRFIEHEYYLYLVPLSEIREVDSPLPDLPHTAEPLPQNRETYKEKRFSIQRIESTKVFSLSFEEQQERNWYLKNPQIPIKEEHKYLFEESI
jgi:predicted transcriptional regulator